MDKRLLLIRISKIHAIKCNKSTDLNVAIAFFDKLSELKEKTVNAANDGEFYNVELEVKAWQEDAPVATEGEVLALMMQN